MSTREEKLKKINAELNKLSDEELDKVAGGSVTGTAEDSQLLFKFRLMKEEHVGLSTFFCWDSVSKQVDAGWARVGITCVTKFAAPNQYFLNGKEISRDEAVAHLKDRFD